MWFSLDLLGADCQCVPGQWTVAYSQALPKPCFACKPGHSPVPPHPDLCVPARTFTNASFQTSFSTISPHLGRYPKVAISLTCIMLPPSRIPHSADFWGAWQAQWIFLTSELQPSQPGLCENCSKKVAEIKDRILLFLTQSDSGCDKTRNSLEFSILNNVYQILPHLGMHQSIEMELKDRKGWENKRRCKKQKEEYEIKGRICQSNLCTVTYSAVTLKSPLYWVGQKVCSGFSIMSYGKTQTNFLANSTEDITAIASFSTVCLFWLCPV